MSSKNDLVVPGGTPADAASPNLEKPEKLEQLDKATYALEDRDGTRLHLIRTQNSGWMLRAVRNSQILGTVIPTDCRARTFAGPEPGVLYVVRDGSWRTKSPQLARHSTLRFDPQTWTEVSNLVDWTRIYRPAGVRETRWYQISETVEMFRSFFEEKRLSGPKSKAWLDDWADDIAALRQRLTEGGYTPAQIDLLVRVCNSDLPPWEVVDLLAVVDDLPPPTEIRNHQAP